MQSNNSSLDLSDIRNWRVSLTKYVAYLKTNPREGGVFIRPFRVDPVKTYALLRLLPPHTPMGIYTALQSGLPMGSLFWWDYIIESEIGCVHIWRSSQTIEAFTHISDPSFNLDTFITSNIHRYKKEIDEVIQSFEEMSVFINHYNSYQMSVNFLWREIEGLDISLPQVPEANVVKNREELNQMGVALSRFRDNSMKFHVMGKSLLLNASFLIESYANLLIRVGAKSDLRENKRIMDRHLSSNFSERLQNLKYFSQVLSDKVDMDCKPIKDALNLMTLRNKYVHYDESSIHNKIGTVYFDGNFPVFPATPYVDVVNKLVMSYHNPTMEMVKNAYLTAQQFITYLDGLIDAKSQKYIHLIMNQNPIAYNESKKLYSYVFSPNSVASYVPNDAPSADMSENS